METVIRDEELNFRAEASKEGGTYVRLWVYDLDDNEDLVCVTIKWDGCANWSFGEGFGNAVEFHTCDRHGVERFGKIMLKCWDWAKENLPIRD